MSKIPGANFIYIETATDLIKLEKKLNSVSIVAIDTEADSLHHYYEKVCLIQLSISDNHYIVDPLVELNLTTFLDILSNTNLILHGSEYDLRMLYKAYKFIPMKSVFDTAIAAQLIGVEKFGLVDLADSYLKIKLSKQGQKSDWSKRPLSAEQMSYAYDDTRYLGKISEYLDNELSELGRIEWHKESCVKVVKITSVDKEQPDPDREWQIKGVRKLNPKQQAVVRELWYWRDAEARAVDLPPFKILANRTIIDLAEWATLGKKLNEAIRPKLPKNCLHKRLDKLNKAIHKAGKL